MSPSRGRRQDQQLEEWKVARDILDKYDERLHDLRKYGFSFAVGLATADSFLASGVISGGTTITPEVKLAVVSVTFVLIGALSLLDKHYQRIERGASVRAKQLEGKIDLDLTRTISFLYDPGWMRQNVAILYLMLTIAVGALGVAVLLPNVLLITLAIIVTAVAAFLVYRSVSWRGTELSLWEFDPTNCKQGDKICIYIWNFREKELLHFDKDEPAWQIVSEDKGALIVQEGKFEDETWIDPDGCYSWELDTSKVPAGRYKIRVTSKAEAGRYLFMQRQWMQADEVLTVSRP